MALLSFLYQDAGLCRTGRRPRRVLPVVHSVRASVTVTEASASAANTEATEDEGTEDFKKKNLFFTSVRQQMQDDGGEDGQQVGEAGRDISSTPSGDVEMFEGQDQELVVGTGTHLDGVKWTLSVCHLCLRTP